MEAQDIFLYGCLALVAGVFMSSLAAVSAVLIIAAAFVSLGFVVFGAVRRKKNFAVAGLLGAAALAGFLRFDAAWNTIERSELAALAKAATAVEFDAVVVEDPQTYDGGQKLVVRSPRWDGKILVSKYRYPEYEYGAELKISGTLSIPEPTDSFDYKNYLAKNGIYAIVDLPSIEPIADNKGSIVFSKIFWLKHKLMDGVYQNLPYPHNALMVAILFGDQSRIPACSAKETALAAEDGVTCAKLKEQFNITGLRHLTAVSGMHVAIMAAVLMTLCLAAGLWRSQAFWLTVGIVWLFILMIGLPASAVRAGVMGTMMLFAQKIGRPASSGRVVVIAATLMVMQNPLVLRFDVGFQLSFLAVMGMIYFSPFIANRLVFLPKGDFFDARGVLSQTLAAQVMTLPILVYNFGMVSVYSAPANMLVVPLVPLMTVAGFVLAFAGAIFAPLAWLVSLPVWLFIQYLISVVETLSRLPAATASVGLPWFGLAACYAAIAFAAWTIHQHERLKFLDY